ncbi:hypothetical protein, partial [Xanthomonas arboricola]|uniref:hypothetical protein n=1 Tax=Xanthomonas arboricola TaxID=56448 RepID=UPI0011B089D6
WDYDYLQPDWATAVQMARAYQNTGATSGVANGYPQSLAGLPDDYSWLDASYYAGGPGVLIRTRHLHGGGPIRLQVVVVP